MKPTELITAAETIIKAVEMRLISDAALGTAQNLLRAASRRLRDDDNVVTSEPASDCDTDAKVLRAGSPADQFLISCQNSSERVSQIVGELNDLWQIEPRWTRQEIFETLVRRGKVSFRNQWLVNLAIDRRIADGLATEPDPGIIHLNPDEPEE